MSVDARPQSPSVTPASPPELAAVVTKLCEVGDGILERCEEIGSMSWRGDHYQFEDLADALGAARAHAGGRRATASTSFALELSTSFAHNRQRILRNGNCELLFRGCAKRWLAAARRSGCYGSPAPWAKARGRTDCGCSSCTMVHQRAWRCVFGAPKHSAAAQRPVQSSRRNSSGLSYFCDRSLT